MYFNIESMKEPLRRLMPRMMEQAATMKTNSWSMGSAPSKMGSKKWSAMEKVSKHFILKSEVKMYLSNASFQLAVA